MLHAARYPILGEAFPLDWESKLGACNPNGFYESPLRVGIYHATNPNPDTGEWLSPTATRRHVVKVFVPGLVRSDFAYLDRVVVCLRRWRPWAASTAAFDAMERAAYPNSRRDPRSLGMRWWTDVYDVMRDIATRRYPATVVTWDQLRRDPAAEVRAVLRWLGGGDATTAVAAFHPGANDVAADAGYVDIPGVTRLMPPRSSLFRSHAPSTFAFRADPRRPRFQKHAWSVAPRRPHAPRRPSMGHESDPANFRGA